MRRFVATVIALIIIAPLFSFPLNTTGATASLPPLTPHQVRVLVVSPSNLYFRGGGYLTADLAGYGFNVTQHTSDSSSVDYQTDPKTANLNQYDVIILQGSYFGQPPTRVTMDEIRHFTNYGGVLILIGNALFVNETSGTRWNDFFFSEPLQIIEQRFGVIITRFLKDAGASEFHNSGTFNLVDNSIPGLPTSLNYVRGTYGASQYQMELDVTEGSPVYDFTAQNGQTTRGITFYRNSTGAVGIFIQGAYIYAEQPGPNRINYLGITDNSKRSAFLASMIAYSLNRDISTIVKPQPLANIRLDGVGQTYSEIYLNASLSNFNSVMDRYSITPTIGFIDYLDFSKDYWERQSPHVLSQLKSIYRDWEYSNTLRYYTDPRLMTQGQIEALIDAIRGNYTKLGIDLFSTVIAPNSKWNQTLLDAMSNRNLYALDLLDTSYADWWNLRINSSIIVHCGVPMLPEKVVINGSLVLAEDFAQPGLDVDTINSKYFTRRDKVALALLNGFPSFIYYVPNFRWDKVGTYSLKVVVGNLTSESPDARFVPLMEGGLYFGNKWMQLQNVVRDNSVVEFDVDASTIPNVVNIGKGMLWIRVNANESIQEVSINNNRWFYFDEHSIRIPAPDSSVHVRVVLGSSPSPRVAESKYKVKQAFYDGYRFNISIASSQNLNASIRLYLPKVGAFLKDNWSILCLEPTLWSYTFDSESRILEFWAISDGFVNFEVGTFWIVDQTSPWYNSSVTITANYSNLDLEVIQAVLSYNLGNEWTNTSAVQQGGLWIGVIPAMVYGTLVRYRLFANTTIDKWFVTEIFSYSVIDEAKPEITSIEWGPKNPDTGQPVNVRVSISEPMNASGVKEAFLRYYTGTGLSNIADARNVTMTNENGTWVADIPGQSGGSIVTFSVVAIDNAGNKAETDAIRYSVAVLSLWLITLMGGAAVTAIVASLYFFKLRKSKPKPETAKQKNDALSSLHRYNAEGSIQAQ